MPANTVNRRKFLRVLGGGTIAAACALTLSSCDQTTCRTRADAGQTGLC